MTFLITIETASCTSLLMFFVTSFLQYYIIYHFPLLMVLRWISAMYFLLRCILSCSYTASSPFDELIRYLSLTFMDNIILLLTNDHVHFDQQ